MRRPINYLKTAKDRLEELNFQIQKLQLRISRAPQGSITCKSDGHSYWNINGKQEYLGKDKESLIKALLQKKYDQGKLETARQEKKVLENALKAFENIKTPKFPEELKKFVTDEEYTDEAYVKNWSKRDNWEFVRRYSTDNSQNFTLKGELVKSKSEIIIADRLYNANIPYHYEACLDLVTENSGVITVKPDFTILNTRTLETWYWEHFGMLDDPKYRNDMKLKLETYADNGLFPGNHLIVSFETKDNQLSSKHVVQLIEEYLK